MAYCFITILRTWLGAALAELPSPATRTACPRIDGRRQNSGPRGQHPARMAAIHVPHEGRVDVVAEEFLQPFWQLPDHLAGDREAVFPLLPQPAGRVFEDPPEPRLPGVVRPAAMPQAAQVEHGRAGRDDRLLDRIV